MMLHHQLSSALLLCLAVLAVPCAFGEPPDLAVRVGKLEQSLSNQGLLDLSQELENLKREVKSLRGELENQTYALEQSKQAQTAVAADFEQRLRHLEGGAASAAGTVAPLPTLHAAPPDAVAGAPAAQGNLQVETNPEAPLPSKKLLLILRQVPRGQRPPARGRWRPMRQTQGHPKNRPQRRLRHRPMMRVLKRPTATRSGSSRPAITRKQSRRLVRFKPNTRIASTVTMRNFGWPKRIT